MDAEAEEGDADASDAKRKEKQEEEVKGVWCLGCPHSTGNRGCFRQRLQVHRPGPTELSFEVPVALDKKMKPGHRGGS